MSVQITQWQDSKGRNFPRLEATGKTLTEAFQEAASGFFSLFTDLSAVAAKDSVVIYCESSDSDWLFSDWINTLIYEIRERGMLFSKFEIHVEGINVKGKIYGEKINPSQHVLKLESLAGAAFDHLSAEEGDQARGIPAKVVAVLNDVNRHPLPLREIWRKA